MKKIWMQIASLLLFAPLLIVFANFSMIYADPQPATAIKIGYMLNYGTIKSPMVKGSEGYGYEYLNKIFEHAKGDYTLEFVYCDWAEGKQMLANGDIDILGPITKTEAGEETYTYPQKSFGDNIIFLSALSENAKPGAHLNINGSTIAVQTGNPNEYLLHEFLQENNYHADIVYFTDNDYENVLDNFGYDYCLSSSLQTSPRLSPVATLGTVDFYYVADVANQSLIDIMDEGMKDLSKNEFLYQEKLYLKYYDYTISTASYLTEEEYKILQEKSYRIGVENLYSPMAYVGDDGSLQGITVDAVDMMAELAGLSYTLVEVTPETTKEELEALDFTIALSYTSEKRDKTIQSDPYYEVPLSLIERADTDICTIGVPSYYGVSEIEVEDHIYGRTLFEYDNVQDMLRSYNKGRLDSFILATPTMNLIRDQFEKLNFISTPLNMNLNLLLTFSGTYPQQQIELANKLIAQLDNSMLYASVLRHSSSETDLANVSVLEILVANPAIITSLIALLLAIGCYFEFRRRRLLSKTLNVDYLTKLPTLYKFKKDAEKIVLDSKRSELSLISLDIDNFKYINEFYGYEIGTNVLQHIASTLKKRAVGSIVIARTSSDNFLLLTRRNGLAERIDASKQIGIAFFDDLQQYIGETYNMTFSIGVYDITDRSLALDFMIDCANIARNKGKTSATTTVVRYTAEMDQERIINNDIVANMASALDNQEFLLHYQPKVVLATGELIGAEALVRWKRDGALIPPDNFIPIFERNGFIERVDYYVLETACVFLQQHPTCPKISVNLSGITLSRDTVVQQILARVQEYDIEPTRLDIEITETALVQRAQSTIEKIEVLRQSGFTISMDDFGAGISSLNQLKNMPIDTLKIDREFIIDSIENPRGAKILQNVIHMAQDLGLETIAEGIETHEQERFLQDLGCDIGQGYYYARPLAEHDFVKLLQAQPKTLG